MVWGSSILESMLCTGSNTQDNFGKMSNSANAYLYVLHCSCVLWTNSGFSEQGLFQRHTAKRAFQNIFFFSLQSVFWAGPWTWECNTLAKLSLMCMLLPCLCLTLWHLVQLGNLSFCMKWGQHVWGWSEIKGTSPFIWKEKLEGWGESNRLLLYYSAASCAKSASLQGFWRRHCYQYNW